MFVEQKGRPALGCDKLGDCAVVDARGEAREELLSKGCSVAVLPQFVLGAKQIAAIHHQKMEGNAALLPDEMLLSIFAHCTARTVLKTLKCVCRHWRAVATEYGCLDFTWANWSAGGRTAFCELPPAIFAELVAFHIKPTTIRLSGAYMLPCDVLVRALSDTPSLAELALVRCNVNNAVLFALATHCPELAAVDFSDCPRNINDGIDVLVRSCPLVSVSLARCRWANDDTLRALARCNTVKQLRLDHTQITPAGLTRLGGAQHVTHLDASGCFLTTFDFVARFRSLTRLCISDFKARRPTDGPAVIRDVIKHCPGITTLGLDSAEWKFNVWTVYSLLSQCDALRSLAINIPSPYYNRPDRRHHLLSQPVFPLTHITSKGINNKSLRMIAAWCPALQVVDVSASPDLTDATGLARPPLMSLNLRGTAITDDTLFALAKHASLSTLSAHDCHSISPAGVGAILNTGHIQDISYRAMHDATLAQANGDAERRGVTTYIYYN